MAEEQLPFAHLPRWGNSTHFWSMLSAASGVWAGGQRGKRLSKTQQASARRSVVFIQPLCKLRGLFFFFPQ